MFDPRFREIAALGFLLSMILVVLAMNLYTSGGRRMPSWLFRVALLIQTGLAAAYGWVAIGLPWVVVYWVVLGLVALFFMAPVSPDADGSAEEDV